MNRRILFVDDEPSLLEVLVRTLNSEFDIETCTDAQEALEHLSIGPEFAVLVSDMKMPKMNGAQLLEEARATAPNTVRLVLTGENNLAHAIDAVNHGQVFRFLTKPIKLADLRATLGHAIRQYELAIAERELMEETVRGCARVLSDILAIAQPEAFGRTDRLRKLAGQIASRLPNVSAWELDTAVSVALLGFIGLTPALLSKVNAGSPLSRPEYDEYLSHPELSAGLLRKIPRMNRIAEIVQFQNKRYDGTGHPSYDRSGDKIPIASRILNVALEFDHLATQGWSEDAILEKFRSNRKQYDPEVLAALEKTIETSALDHVMRLPVTKLRDGMTIQEDVMTTKNILLICKGHTVTPPVRDRLRRFAEQGLHSGLVLVSIDQK